MNEKLIFVYNADSGFISGIFDFFHKMMKPSTYKCDLCMITHNYLGMRKAWKSYLDSLPYEKDYFHKDEFEKMYPINENISFPAVFLAGEELEPIIMSDELEDIDLAQLTTLLQNRLISCRIK